MKRFARGSEWRKWDLHLHVPGTKLSDGYGADPDWDSVCRVIEESDVAVIGITDYFSFDSYHTFVDQFEGRYPESRKTFFPCIELRLNEAVNKDLQNVNFHLIFRPSIPRFRLDRFLQELKAEIFDERSRQKSCAELEFKAEFEKATVTRRNIDEALRATFGEREHWSCDVVTAVPANNDGIRADSGVARKANLADQIDKRSSIVFGSRRNVEYFLSTDRLEDGAPSTPKPVFSGSDSHSLEHLEARLGKTVNTSGSEIEPTWVKADPTFDGLLQTLIEPEHRVRIQTTRPDPREPYQYMSGIRFTGSSDFPLEIKLNSNLVSIIGARSSGKSSLLAYIAHAVDPDYVIRQQMEAKGISHGETGPAAGKTWHSVQHIKCTVEWGDAATKTGRVIYIPQNSLYAISERPNEITAKVEPAIHRLSPEFAVHQKQVAREVEAQNSTIEQAVRLWFAAQASFAEKNSMRKSIGDRSGVESERDKLTIQVAMLQEASSLTPEDLHQYSEFLKASSTRQSKIHAAEATVSVLDSYMTASSGATLAEEIGIEINVQPSIDDLPGELRAHIGDALRAAAEPLRNQIKQLIAAYRDEIGTTLSGLRLEIDSEQQRHQGLIARNSASTELNEVVRRRQKQEVVLAQIDSIEAEMESIEGEISELESQVVEALARRTRLLSGLKTYFEDAVPPTESGMTFGIEAEISSEAIEFVSRSFNLRDRSTYVDRERSGLRVDQAQNQPIDFMLSVLRGNQKLRQGEDPQAAVVRVLATTQQVRFFASLDGDRIGGFEPSSMTPGKQALFALTLILDESDEPWPLLIDQPEDDLDSRSIYDQIVPYLVKRKRERQILMVTHNANLVVGADSEQVIVANRNGDDRKNHGGQEFAYLSGSLEHSKVKDPSCQSVLEACGIREHACEILDGGSDAFRKRMEKYRINT